MLLYYEAVIVFDGYHSEPSTKEMNQIRRRGSANSPKVKFEETNEVSLKRDIFLANKENKKAFVHHLGMHPKKAGYVVKYASSDADTQIVKSAIEASEFQNVTLVGDDTDLLCLLIFHFSTGCH